MNEDQETKSFAELLAEFMNRSGFKSASLVTEINRLFGGSKASPVVHRSNIERWLDGGIPREWRYVAALATACRLTRGEANQLLKSAQKPPIHELWISASASERRFLNYWASAAPWQDLQQGLEQISREVKILTGGRSEDYSLAETFSSASRSPGLLGGAASRT